MIEVFNIDKHGLEIKNPARSPMSVIGFRIIFQEEDFPTNTNSLRIPAVIKGHARLIDSPEYRNWKEYASLIVIAEMNRREMFGMGGEYELCISTSVYQGGRSLSNSSDLDGRDKAARDLMKTCGLIVDDSMKYITKSMHEVFRPNEHHFTGGAMGYILTKRFDRPIPMK